MSKPVHDLLGITNAFRHFHDHRLDPAYGGRYFMRLPDGTCVPFDQYEERLAAYRARSADRPFSDAPDDPRHAWKP